MQQQLQFNLSILKRFVRLNKAQKLAHAYLFVGPSGIGKKETALAVAKLLNCEDPAEEMFCGVCPSCVRTDSGNHPDVFAVDNEEGATIKIEQIRELVNRGKLRSFMGGKKVFIIRNIENLTVDAANAFLKNLEEPTPDSLIVLTACATERVLDTIKSRCHKVHFPLMPDRELTAKIMDEFDVGKDRSQLYAYFAQGSYRKAQKLSEDQFDEWKNEVIDDFVLNRPHDPRVKELLADKDATKQFLDVLLSWMRDCLLAKAGVKDGRLVHVDRVDDLRRFVKRYTFEELNVLNESVIKMCRLLADNLNIKLPLLIIGEQLWGR